MAVGTNDVALRDFGEDRVPPGPSDHLAHQISFLARVTMIELHDEERKSSPAIQAWDPSQIRKKLGVSLAIRGSSCQIWRGSLRSSREDILGLDPVVRPDRVTVRTDDVALRDFREENVPRLQ